MQERIKLAYLLITFTATTCIFADVLITELTDPQNSSDAGRYVELYNNGDADVDLSTGWALQRWTNGNADPQSPKFLSGTISSGGFYIVCNNLEKFSTTYGLTCDQSIGTGGPADSNGDDNMALLDDSGAIVDMFGVAGEDGSGTGHEFEDGRAERAEGVTAANPVWDVAEWNIDNDSGGGDGNQYAPEGYDPFEWIGATGGSPSPDYVVEVSSNIFTPNHLDIEIGQSVQWINIGGYHNVDGRIETYTDNPESFYSGGPSTDAWTFSYTFSIEGTYDYECTPHASIGMIGSITVGDAGIPGCTDSDACNFNPDATDDDGSCEYEIDCAGVCGGDSVEDCAGECDGDAVVDECGDCGGSNECFVSVTFNVNMATEDVSEDGVAVYGFDGDWWNGNLMTDNGEGVYSTTLSLAPTMQLFKYKNGSAWEDVDDLDCAYFDDPDGDGFGYWDRWVDLSDGLDQTLETVCFNTCEDCPTDILGCTDPEALNYDENATVDDGSCFYDWPEISNLFFSEAAEGSSNNKYLEIYNGTDSDVDLGGYSLSSCSNGCNDGVNWDYPDNVTFEEGTLVSSADVYVVCHGSADDIILAECDQTFTYLSNGDDVFALTQIGSGSILDIIGSIGDDPGYGWDVAGVTNATKDHTLVRKSSVESGNSGDWESSAGTDADNSEWIVLDQNTWDNLGYHDQSSESCTTGDVNEDGDLNVLDVVIVIEFILGNDTFSMDCGDMNLDGEINVLDVVIIIELILFGT